MDVCCVISNGKGELNIKRNEWWISNANLNCAPNKIDSKIRKWMHVLMQSIFQMGSCSSDEAKSKKKAVEKECNLDCFQCIFLHG